MSSIFSLFFKKFFKYKDSRKGNFNDTSQFEDREMARKRHDDDSGIFQGRYVKFELGRFTDPFIYGRYQIFEEVKKDLDRLNSGSKVLDLGSGTGHLCKFIRDKGFEVKGLDPSKEMLSYARNNFPDIGFCEGVSAQLPFEDGEFDYVVSIEVLRYLNPKDVAKTYSEIFRVLKPSGFFNVTHVNRWATDFYVIYYTVIRFFITLSGKKYHNCYFTTASEEEDLIRKSGFLKTKSLGRMFASIRIGYKFGIFIGRLYALVLEVVNKKQVFKGRLKNFSGHLIIRGFKE